MPDLMTPNQVAERLHVSHSTVVGWITAGLMPALDISRANSKRRMWRISDEDIAEFKRRRQPQLQPVTPRKPRRDIPKLV